jgi:inner membrane protease ATP23
MTIENPGAAPPEAPTSALPNDPAVTGYDPSARWTNYFNILTSRMTPAGQLAMREDAYIRNESRDIARCEEWRDWLFTYSPTVIFLRSKIRELNGELDENNVICRRCPTRVDEKGTIHRQGGGFSAPHGILICANEMRDKKHLEDTLAHEMVHAWDHLRWKVDEGDLRHAACTEVSVP